MGVIRLRTLCAVTLLACSGAVARAQPIVLTPPPVTAKSTSASAAEALRSGNSAVAEELASEALNMGTLPPLEQARALLTRGLARNQQGERAGAEADHTAAIDLGVLAGRDLAHAYFDRGVARDELGRADDALADYEAALKLFPKFPAALNNRANVYRRLGKLDEAKRDYTASLDAGNKTPQYAFYGLGQIAEAQDDVPAARAWYEKSVEADASYTLPARRLAAMGDDGTYAQIILKKPRARVAQTIPTASPAPRQTASMPPLRPAILDGPPARETQVALSRPRKSPRTSGAGIAAVQLGSFRAEVDAATRWNRLQSTAGNLLGGLSPRIEAADIPGRGRYYRLRAGAMDFGEAANLCGTLKAQGLDCIAVRG